MSRRLLAVPVAAVLAWSLTACAGDAPAPPAGLTASASPTEEPVAEPAGFVLTADTLDDLTGAMLAAQTYDLSMVVEAGPASMTSQGQARATEAGTELTMTTSGADAPPVEIRLVGGQMYVNMGELTGGLFWQIDAADTTNPLAAAMAQSTSASSAADSLAALLPALVSVETSGPEEEIDGVSTQPYDLVVDTSKLAGPTAEQFSSSIDQAGVDMPAQITYRYWIGSDQLPRKLSLDLLGTHLEMLLSNWGGPVTIEAPPADQVTAAPAM
ncbi:hypothetical protein [Cellulomonas sp. P5_C5]